MYWDRSLTPGSSVVTLAGDTWIARFLYVGQRGAVEKVRTRDRNTGRWDEIGMKDEERNGLIAMVIRYDSYQLCRSTEFGASFVDDSSFLVS